MKFVKVTALSHLILSWRGPEVLANLSTGIESETVIEIEKEKGRDLGIIVTTMREIEVAEGTKESM